MTPHFCIGAWMIRLEAAADHPVLADMPANSHFLNGTVPAV
jgi:hypothetical protein